MLSQRLLNVIKLSRNKALHALNTQQLTISTGILNRNKENLEKSNLDIQEYVEEREKKKAERQRDLKQESYNIIFYILHANITFTPEGIKKYFYQKHCNYKKYEQLLNKEKIEYFGPDLGSAHFIINEGGKVKFKGSDKWIQKNEDEKTANIPTTYNPDYILTAIDVSGIELYYESLEIFSCIPKVTHINFARSPYFDDWFMDKLSNMFPNLEYLDVSDCPRLSERGLEALYKTAKLKTLIITNHYKTAAFELSCMMLEEIHPKLKIKILEPKEKMKPIINRNLDVL